MLSSSPLEGEAALEADSNSAEQKVSHTAKNRRKKEKKKLKSWDGAGGCSDLEGASSQVLVLETRGACHESLAVCSTRRKKESASASVAESSESPPQNIDQDVDEVDESRVVVNPKAEKALEKSTARSETRGQHSSAEVEGAPGEECGSGSEEGDVERRFWECGNWSDCPWRVEPLDTRPHVLLKCGSCHVARYCSKDCQTVDWAEHKDMCRVNCLVETMLKRQVTHAQEDRCSIARLQKNAQNLRNCLQESPERRRAGGHSKEAEAKMNQENKLAWRTLEALERFKDIKLAHLNLPRSDVEVRLDKKRVISKTIPKFVTKFGVVLKGRALRVGQWLCAQHESKGAISMEFESKAAIEHATRWLDRNKHTFEEVEDNIRGDIAAFDRAAHMMEQLFLVAQIKGLTQLRYLTLSEAKVEAVKRVKSPSGQFESVGVFSGITEKLIKDIERYDEKRSVIVLIHLKMEEVGGGEPFLCWFVN